MGQVPQARERYESAIRTVPGSPLAYQRLAQIQIAEGDRAAAMATLQSGIEATKRSGLLVLTLAAVQQEAGDYDAAIAAYEEVLKTHPGAESAANNLAMIIADHRAEDPADLARARELVAQFEGSERAAFLDTAGWVQYRSGNYERAAELLKKAIGLEEATPERQFHLGMAYLKSGRAEEGKALLTSAVESGRPFAGIEEARAALQAP